MKTLDEVEPRVPISSLPYTISASGSYYLTGDLTTDSNSISVEANDVTIDLMGYSLTGSGSAGSGVWMGYSPRSNIEIRNGTVRNFLLGVGAMFASHRNVRIIGLRVHGNTAGGLLLDAKGCLVKDCTVSGNDNWGISCGDASTVVDNVVYDNNHSGIRAGSGSTITGNMVTDNNSVGISADYVCTVSENTVANNTNGGIDANSGCSVTYNTVGSNGRYGIVVLDASTVTGNTASFNTEDGIQVNGRSNITYNTCVGNGFGGDGAGIHVVGSTGARVEGNNVTGNDTGIDVDACCNIIIKNTARENTIDYSIAGSNSYGPIVNVAGVGDISSDPNAAHPWANFEF
jgi:parallel beta-helix repeat protein